jgi:hypothetical protein
VLVFGGIPIGAAALVAILVLAPGAMRAPRYRPGGAWDYQPVWYLPHPQHSGPISSAPAAGHPALPAASAEPVRAGGGASGEW